MATVKKCDRCEKIYTNDDKNFKVNNRVLTHIQLWNYADSRIAHCDLCDECCEKLIKFLNNKED